MLLIVNFPLLNLGTLPQNTTPEVPMADHLWNLKIPRSQTVHHKTSVASGKVLRQDPLARPLGP